MAQQVSMRKSIKGIENKTTQEQYWNVKDFY